ncbi:unnamed protein product [Rhizophagus irregularis]|nr:unnamed protein product [Rhizophagus irregularis]
MDSLEDQRGSDNNKFEDFNNLNKVFSNRIKEVNRNQDKLTDKSKLQNIRYDNGFGTHPRREFEIFSYIISGELQHKDSMGNVEILKRGDVNSQQLEQESRILNITYINSSCSFSSNLGSPDDKNLTPAYNTKTYPGSLKTNNLTHIISPASSKTIGIHTDFHITGGQLKINDGIILKPGDGAFITEVVNGEEFIFESVGKEAVEFVLFDLA